jgi:hypothetical protein
MTIDEIQRARADLEERVQELIIAFEDATGAEIDRIDLYRLHVASGDGRRILATVSCDLKLP